MTSLVRASLRHYRGIHALVVAGVAVAVAVLAGALLVGASVRASLRELALSRLGNTDVVITSPTYFRAALAGDLDSPDITGAAPLLAVPGAAVHEASRRTAARVQVFGIDERFLRFHGHTGDAPRDRDAWISRGLAVELGAAEGDTLLLRVAKPTDIPLSHLQGRRDEASERVRVTLTRIVDRDGLGEFSLVPSQGPAMSVFVSRPRLQQDLAIGDSANAIVVQLARPVRDAVADVRTALDAAVQLDDLGLRTRTADAGATTILESRSGLIAEPLWRAAALRAYDQGASPRSVLTYLANSIRVNGREIPYSLVAAYDLAPEERRDADQVTASPEAPPIRLNEWAAADLGAAPGDRVEIDYFLWSDQDGLQTRTHAFTLAGVVPMAGAGGDRSFTPEYPGITDAGDVMSWDPPFPIELGRVRKVDEAYWDEWNAAPKAFIPLSVGQALWPSPFGTVSSLRTASLAGWPPVLESDTALAVRDARGEAVAAAEGTTDFGEYFVYFSFFLVAAGLLLAGMFFALGVEQRAREVGLLLAVGYRARDVRALLVREAAVLTAAGGLIGMAAAVGYAAIIMHGLRTWWVGAVNTTALDLHVDPLLLAGGAIAAILSALAALWLAMRAMAARSTRSLLLGGLSQTGRERRLLSPPIAAGSTILALALVAAGLLGLLPPVAAFFGAGGLLLIAGCAAFAVWLRHPRRVMFAASSVAGFGAAYTRWRPTRSVTSAALIAFACFVIVAVAAFRRDAAGLSLAPESGTGGFVLMAESVAPLMHNPNLASGREELSLSGYDEIAAARISRFRLRPGDEASCLNLYQPTNPRIVAPEASFLDEQRFAFARTLAASDEERANPWRLLTRRFDDGAVPAIADLTSLTYVFHLAVGDDFVFTPEGGEPVRLRIVGALADSVLQSELIIGEDNFVRLFPTHEGYRVWLIDAPAAGAGELTTLLEDRLSDYGVDVMDTRARLAAYHEVENTYLSTFQALGALGLLLGTLGLAAVLARNVLERRRELGLLGAVGFTPANLRTLVTAESLVLVVTGVGVGTLAALVAIAPAIVERASGLPYLSLALLIAAVLTTGIVASLAAVRLATSVRVVDALKNE